MKKLIKRIFRGKYYKNGESYVDTIVKVIICVVVGSLLLTSVYAVAKSALESAKNKVNGLLDYNPNGEDGPGGGDISVPGEEGNDESEPEESTKPYLTFKSKNQFTISVESPKWDGTMEYSTDTDNWTTWDGSEIQSVEGKLYLRGTGNTRVSSDGSGSGSGSYSQFRVVGTDVECVGNIETLLDWNTVLNGEHPRMNSYCFASAFRDCSALITAPALPATTLAIYCYSNMFNGCTSLTTAPALPANNLAGSCYSYMFYGCTNLKISTTQSGIYQYEWRIPTSGTISSAPSYWSYDMLTNTGGTFTGDPDINTTYYLEYPPVE